MSGQTTRENVEQEVEHLLDKHLGTTWERGEQPLFEDLVDLILEYLK
jgi:hypothetical protein